ncbi:unnamed protein product [Pseudo-nitzschia multistriata]|uniref:DNA-directed RNA polymerase I subunit RPA49 n=1 Tax=Pseudo-nitzschia multistriata TaxID=183589 RepID=A0A448ZCD4_9STRA|nr:unnamed protein product [Pseudo-nitzschia multistriata]
MARSQEKKKVIVKVDESTNPIVVSFPGGLPESVENHKVKAPQFVWQKSNGTNKRGRTVVGYDRHCIYSASARGFLYDDRRTKICVGVYDKKRGSVQLFEGATKGTVFSLRQSVPTYAHESGDVESNLSGTAAGPNIFEDFGSQKKRRVLKSQAANRVDVNHVVGAGTNSQVVNQIMQGQAMSESNKKAIADSKHADTERKTANEVALEEARKQLIPEYNQNASDPSKVFNAKSIAGEKAWGRVHRKVTACLHQDNPIDTVVQSIFERDWCDFVIKLVKEVSPDSKSSAFRITCAILVNWMAKFYQMNKSKRSIEAVSESKSSHFGIPIEVVTRCLELFATAIPSTKLDSDTGKKVACYVMSKQNKEKMIMHILLLFMIAGGTSMKIADIGIIAESLKVPVEDCSALLKYAGCTIARKGNKLSATLKTPLKFPKVGRRNRR